MNRENIKNPNQLKFGSILTYIQMFLNIVIGLLYSPVMIRLLGQSEYGLYNTVCSTIFALSILSLGFNSSYIRFFSQYKKDNNRESISKLNGLYLIIFTVIGLVALICGLFLTFNLKIVFKTGLTEEEYKTAETLMIILTLNLTLSFPATVLSSIISSYERFIFLKIIGIIGTIVSPLLTLPLLLSGYRSIAMAVVSVAINLILYLTQFIYVKFKIKESFCFHGFERGLIGNLLNFTVFIAINLIIDQINWNIDKLLLARFKGTASVAVYTVGYSLYNYYMSFSSAVSGVFTPRIHNIFNELQNDINRLNMELTTLFIKVGRIQFLVLSLLASGLLFFGKPFIHFWVGDEYANSYWVALLLILPASIALIQNLGIEIQRAENLHKFRSIAYLIMAILNLITSIFLCKKYGAIGSAIGTAVSLVVANGLIMNIYYYRKCGLDIPLFWKNILRQSLGLVIPIIFGITFNYFVQITNIWLLATAMVSYTVVFCISMWLIGMNEYEKGLIANTVKRILGRQ